MNRCLMLPCERNRAGQISASPTGAKLDLTISHESMGWRNVELNRAEVKELAIYLAEWLTWRMHEEDGA